MKKKLTLRIEDSLIKRAKQQAHERNTSLSQIVSDYFSLMDSGQKNQNNELPPVTSSLSGILKDADINEEDYKNHLESKYLT